MKKDYQFMARALYLRLGTWRKVADACAEHGGTPGPGYYWRMAATGIERPSEANARGVLEAARALGCVSMALTSPRRRAARKNVSVSLDVAARLEAAKSARGDVTWDTLLDEAAGLLEEVGR